MAAFRNRYGAFLPADTSQATARLLFTGAICRNKGIDILLEALTRLDNSEWTLRLVGRILPWERKWFEDALKASGLSERVECPGALDRTALLHEYRHAHLYVFPSRFEGSPRSVREALASGLPCVLSDLPGHRAVDPENTFTRRVIGFDPQDWADAIADGLSESQDAWMRRRSLGVAHMQQAHSPTAVASRLVDIYRRTLSSPPHHP